MTSAEEFGAALRTAAAAIDDARRHLAALLLESSATHLRGYLAEVLGTAAENSLGSATREPDDGTRGADGTGGPGTAARTTPQGLTQEQFSWATSTAKHGTAHLGGELAVQGSRAAGTAKPGSDIDFAIRVDRSRFDELIAEKFKTPNPGSANERTRKRAIESGKIQSGELGISRLRRRLKAGLGMKVDISAIRRDGPFDNPPFMGAPE